MKWKFYLKKGHKLCCLDTFYMETMKNNLNDAFWHLSCKAFWIHWNKIVWHYLPHFTYAALHKIFWGIFYTKYFVSRYFLKQMSRISVLQRISKSFALVLVQDKIQFHREFLMKRKFFVLARCGLRFISHRRCGWLQCRGCNVSKISYVEQSFSG